MIDGRKCVAKIKLDYNKALFGQLWDTKMTYDEYFQFINEPKHLVNPIRDIRCFDNPYLEQLSMTPWYAIPTAYIPLVLYHIMISANEWYEVPFCLALGIFIWTFNEYMLHRFLFHCELTFMPRSNSTFYVMHFFVHGIHHAFP